LSVYLLFVSLFVWLFVSVVCYLSSESREQVRKGRPINLGKNENERFCFNGKELNKSGSRNVAKICRH